VRPVPKTYALILAGGRGTRFWPRSRARHAKQVLEFLPPGALIQQAVSRLEPVFPPERVWVLTNPALRGEIVRQLPQVPRRQILAEPVQRNTAPAIGLAARILNDLDPDAVMGVFPADHVIQKPARFLKLVRAALREAACGKIALLGIEPRWPETGYGYLEFAGGTAPGARPVARFREKPDLATAKRYLRSGRHAWNAGMFFWRASVLLDELRTHLPVTAGLLDSLPMFGTRAFARRLAAVFPRCENISIDYAVLEKAQGVVGFAAGDIAWSDVGSWNAVYELLGKDPEGNTVQGSALLLDARGNYVEAPHKLIALVGVENLVVVDTPDALLIVPRALAQRVGEAVKVLEKAGRGDLL
jgi:mannose-1-phosphate guanylyltransferase